MVPCERSCHKEYTCQIWKPYLLYLSNGQCLSFSKVGQTSRLRSQGQKLLYHVKGLVIRNKHVKYEALPLKLFRVMTNVKVFVHAIDADTDADTRAMTLAPRHTSRLAKNLIIYLQLTYSVNFWKFNPKQLQWIAMPSFSSAVGCRYVILSIGLMSPVRTPGVYVENTSSVSPACRKRRLKGRRYIAIVADTAYQ